MSDPATPEPSPQGDGDMVLFYVLKALLDRAELGQERYGTLLKTGNGRDSLMDAFQEAADLLMYLAQAIMERDNSK